MVAAGMHVIADAAGGQPELVLKWNAMPAAPSAVDVVLHLHGYSPNGGAMDLVAEKLPLSGLDFSDPEASAATPGRTRPTLCILPRGRHFGGRTGSGYDFPVLVDHGAAALLEQALDRFAAATGIAVPRIARRILTAHSGGGQALMAVADQVRPHEMHVFDALYAPAPALEAWAVKAIAADLKDLRPAAEHGHALRVLYIAQSGTEAASMAVGEALERALLAAPALMARYRVEAVNAPHGDVGRTFGWQLLADPAAKLCRRPHVAALQ